MICLYRANRNLAKIKPFTLRCTLKIQTLKLGTVCQDRATQLTGTLTHWILDIDQNLKFVFQPKGLDSEGLPVDYIILGLARLVVEETDFEDVDVPFEILGTEVTDKATGFTGMAVDFIRHINGCFHVTIQPLGTVESTKQAFKKFDFDLRRCTGPKIVELSEPELAKSIERKPSPTGKSLGSDMPHHFGKRIVT